MTFISYAQNFEDVMLWRALKNVQNGFYIDIGAAWPEEHSVTKAFYEKGWYGINVEPNPELFNMLATHRIRDVNLECAVIDHCGVQTMNIIADTGLSTLKDSIASKHIEVGFEAKKISVSAITLAELWYDHVGSDQEVHFLKIDVEGSEEAVLQGNDWKKNRPWIVVVEATMPLSQAENYEEWEMILCGNDYLCIYQDGLNRFYVAKEQTDLIPSFRYPPNLFDSFKLASLCRAEDQISQMESSARKAEDQISQMESSARKAEDQISQMESSARKAEDQISQMESSARKAEDQISQMESSARKAEAQEQRLQNELVSIRTSRSWRYTKPLRRLLSILQCTCKFRCK